MNRFCQPLCLTALVVFAAGCNQPAHQTLLPPPIDDQQAQDGIQENAEEENQEKRRQWMEEMHRAAPGVDWRAIERENAAEATDRKDQARLGRAASTGNWTEVGSRDQAGNVLTITPTDDMTTLYAGSALGGVFRAGIDGSNWIAISDHIYGGVSHLVAIPNAPGDEILVRVSGGTILRSTDLGNTWHTPTGLSGMTESKRLLMLDDANHTLYLIARNSGWKLYRSVDQGTSFQLMRDMTGYKPDIWTPRDAVGALYLMDDNRLWKSTNKGLTFTAMGNTAAISPTDIQLGGHESSGGTTFSLAVNTGTGWELWRTTNGGANWSHASDLPGMWNAFCTGTQTDKLIAYGGVDMYYSRDSGASFQTVNSWAEYYGDPGGKLHADIMSISAMPDATSSYGERWYVNTHGGSYQSMDRLRTVENLTLSGLGVSQYYSSFTSRRDPKYLAVGAQDQGYQRGIVGTPSGQPGPYVDLPQLISGDYGHLSSSDGSHDIIYSDYPGFVLVQEGEENPSLRTVDFPNGFSGQWLPFMVADPTDKKAFYLCGQKLWRYLKSNNNWSPVQHTTHNFGGTLSSITFSPLDPQRAWCCTTGGSIFYSTDGAVTWTQSVDTGPGAHYFYGTTIVASQWNVDEVWIAGSGYSNPPVRFSDDGGVTWKNRSQNLPNTLAYGMVEGPDGSGSMYLATQSGAWEWDPVAKHWNDILGSDGPLTLYWAVEAVPSTNTIRFATYGRGVWDYEPGTAGFFPYGELRPDPNFLQLRADAQPIIGTNLTLTVSGGPANSSGYLAVCSQADETPYFGGLAFVDLSKQVQLLQLQSNASGVATVGLSIPNNASLVGQEYYLQAVMLDGTQPAGWAMSHGLRAFIGD